MENNLRQMQALLEEGTSFVCVTLVDIKGVLLARKEDEYWLQPLDYIPEQLEEVWLRQKHWNSLKNFYSRTNFLGKQNLFSGI